MTPDDLRAWLTEHRLSQIELAVRLDCNPRTVRRYLERDRLRRWKIPENMSARLAAIADSLGEAPEA